MIRKIRIGLFVFGCVVLVMLAGIRNSGLSGEAYQQEISEAVLRLHVRADNNSPRAQQIKLSVRDAILHRLEKYEKDMKNKKSAKAAAKAHLKELQTAAGDVLKDWNCPYGVDIKIEKTWFPKKSYGDVTLPEGMYDAVVAELGSGRGENWWCVLFPKLCFVTPEDGQVPQSGKEALSEALSEEAYDAITGYERPRFKIVEWFEKIW